jgi:hypothetical protein
MRMGCESFRTADTCEDEAAPGIAATALPTVTTAKAVRTIKFFMAIFPAFRKAAFCAERLKTGF